MFNSRQTKLHYNKIILTYNYIKIISTLYASSRLDQ